MLVLMDGCSDVQKVGILCMSYRILIVVRAVVQIVVPQSDGLRDYADSKSRPMEA